MIRVNVYGDEFFLFNETTGLQIGPFDTTAMVASMEQARCYAVRTGLVAPFEMVKPIGRQDMEGNGARIDRALAQTGIDTTPPQITA